MTFTPTPKADLWTPEQEYDAWVALGQQLFSRQHHSQAAQDTFAANIADLYSRLPGSGSTWLWSGTPADVNPGTGHLSVIITTGTGRIITISKTDADGAPQSLAALAQGSTIVLTDDPDSPPTTAFRQYLVTSTPAHFTSWAQVSAIRVSTFGSQDTPTVDTRVRMLFR